jgi:hypothetical protein
MDEYTFRRGLAYPAIVATSQRVAWTVDEIFVNRRFDATKPIVPDSWVGTGQLAFLDEREQRTLNHIRAFSYAHLLGNYEVSSPYRWPRWLDGTGTTTGRACGDCSGSAKRR